MQFEMAFLELKCYSPIGLVFSLVRINFSPFENQGGNSNQISEILFYPAISGN